MSLSKLLGRFYSHREVSGSRFGDSRVLQGSCPKRQKPQAPTPQAPIRNRQTRKFANAKVRNRYTNLTYMMIGLPIIWRLRALAFATFLVWRLRIGACGFWRYRMYPAKIKAQGTTPNLIWSSLSGCIPSILMTSKKVVAGWITEVENKVYKTECVQWCP